MRMLARSILVVCLGLGSHAVAGERVDPAGAGEREALRGQVLVWHDATFLTAPSDDAATLQLATFDRARKDRLGHVMPMRVVAARGAFVELEPVDEVGCTWSRMSIPDDVAKLRLYVKRSDLAPVLTKAFTKVFPDGTRLALAPGVPVIAAEDGTYVVSLRGDELVAEIPAAAVGHAYKPERTRSISMPASVLAVAPGTTATLGDRTITLTASRGAAVERRGDSTVLALEERCAIVHVAVPTKALADTDEEDESLSSGGGNGSGVLGLRDELYLPALTPLSVGAHRIAYARKPIYLLAAPTGKTACVERRLRIESAVATLDPQHTGTKLRLCAPASKVVRERMRSARSGNGSTTR